MRFRKLAVLAVILALAAFAAAQAQEYKIDQGHSHVGFTAKHLMISNVDGRFHEFAGTVSFDPKDLTRSAVKVTIQTASVDTDNSARDNDLHNSELLDVAQFPAMTFESTRVEKHGDAYVLVGNLTIKGVTKPVQIPFTINGPINDPWGMSRLAAEGSTTINRRDFNVTYNHAAKDGTAIVGDQIRINLSIEAVRPAGK
jgi:polyisoprenoid-binding protein YceI